MQLSRTDDVPYERFFGLREQPFALTTDPRFHYKTESHRRAFDELKRGLERGEGFLLLTGDTGTGKTTLSRAVIDVLGGRTFSAIISNPAVADAELLRVVLRDFGVVSREEIRRGRFESADAQHLHETLESFLRSLAPLGARAVLVVDEAQGLAPRTLEQLRLLGNMEADGRRLIQIILSGQRRLETTLAADDMTQLSQRISRRVQLEPMSKDEVEQYIAHRLQVAGGEAQVGFTPDASALVHRLAKGFPRSVNLICDRALDEARVDAAPTVTAEHVRRAARAIKADDAEALEAAPRGTAGGRRWLKVLLWLLLLAVLAAAGSAAYVAWRIDQAPAQLPAVAPAPKPAPPVMSTPPPPDQPTSRPGAGA
ncbi:MAG TPA: AAA family ATPase [Vicinamibacterales bacterium]|nr:AAA family ATPase [Vicinamibacterales bacterium]